MDYDVQKRKIKQQAIKVATSEYRRRKDRSKSRGWKKDDEPAFERLFKQSKLDKSGFNATMNFAMTNQTQFNEDLSQEMLVSKTPTEKKKKGYTKWDLNSFMNRQQERMKAKEKKIDEQKKL